MVPGRTWWYSSSYVVADPLTREMITTGLRLAEQNEIDAEGWVPCYVVDRQNNRVLGASIASLKEEDSKVWVRPNLHLYDTESDKDSFEAKMIFDWLGFRDGYFYPYGFRNAFPDVADIQWAEEDGDNTYLLYDYSYTIGDTYQWPWSGMGHEFPYAYYEFQEEVFIDNIGLDNTLPGEPRNVFTINQYFVQDCELAGSGKIIEGIGIVNGDFEMYSEFRTWYGYWLCPLSLGYVATTGFLEPSIPELESVVDADGTVIYGDPVTVHPAKQGQTSEPEREYDIHGLPVKENAKGIIIKNGKKIFR